LGSVIEKKKYAALQIMFSKKKKITISVSSICSEWFCPAQNMFWAISGVKIQKSS